MIKIEGNRFGKICVSFHVLENIIKDAVENREKKLILLHEKRKIAGVLPSPIGNTEDIHFAMNQDGIDIKVDVVFKFGCSIKKLTDELSDEIKREIENTIGIRVKRIVICIKGTMLKNHIAKRDLEIETNY